MRYTQNINLPIVEDNDLYSKEINNLAFEKIDEEIQGLADIVETLDSPENSIADVKSDIRDIKSDVVDINEQLDNIAIDVKRFGAKGDGITDDSDAIQNAINHGSKIYFPKGDYLITKPLIINSAKVLYGLSKEKTKIIAKSTLLYGDEKHSIIILKSKDISIEDITLNGGSFVDYGVYIDNTSTSGIKYKNMLVEYVKTGFDGQGSFFLSEFNDVTVRYVTNGFITLNHSEITSIYMKKCYVHHADYAYKLKGIYCECNNICADDINEVVFTLSEFDGSFISPGSEAITTKKMFELYYSSVVIHSPNIFGNTSENHIHFDLLQYGVALVYGGTVSYIHPNNTVMNGQLYQLGLGSEISFNDTKICGIYNNNNRTFQYTTSFKCDKNGFYKRRENSGMSYIGYDYNNTGASSENAIFFGFGSTAKLKEDGTSLSNDLRYNLGDILLTKKILSTGGLGWVCNYDASIDNEFIGTITEVNSDSVVLSDFNLTKDYNFDIPEKY